MAALSVLQSYLQIHSLNHDVRQSITAQTKQLSSTASSQLSIWLNDKLTTLKAVAQQDPNSPDFAKKLYQNQLAGGFSSSYYGDETGKVVVGDPDESLPYGYDPRNRIWYIGAQQQSPYFSDPYMATDGNLVMTLSVKAGSGVFSSNLPLDSLKTQMKSLSTDNITAFIVSNDGVVLIYPDSGMVEQMIDQLDPSLTDETIAKTGVLHEATLSGVPSLVSFNPIPNTNWSLGLSFNKQAAFADVQQKLLTSLIYNGIMFIIVALVIYILITIALRPLKQLQRSMAALGSGDADLTQRLNLQRNDEIGQLGHSVDIFLERLQQLLLQVSNHSQTLQGNTSAVNQAANDSAMATTSQRQQISEMAQAFNEITEGAEQVSQHAEQTQDAVETSQLACTSGQQIIEENQQLVKQLGQRLQATAVGVTEIEQSSDQINDILETIRAISEQTNLLALNAAIEAARAGEHGRGFAVVADEVRNLSSRTQQSTEQIRDVLTTLVEKTAHTVKSMKDSQALAHQSVEQADRASEALDHISASIANIQQTSLQIATTSEQQRIATVKLRDNTQGIEKDCQNLHQHASSTIEQAATLRNVATHLDQQMQEFIL